MNRWDHKKAYLLKGRVKILLILGALIFISLLVEDINELFFFKIFSILFLLYLIYIIYIMVKSYYYEKEFVLVSIEETGKNFCKCLFLDVDEKKIIKYSHRKKANLNLKIDFFYRVLMNEKGMIVTIIEETNKGLSNELINIKNSTLGEHNNKLLKEKISEIGMENTKKNHVDIWDVLKLIVVFDLLYSIYCFVLETTKRDKSLKLNTVLILLFLIFLCLTKRKRSK